MSGKRVAIAPDTGQDRKCWAVVGEGDFDGGLADARYDYRSLKGVHSERDKSLKFKIKSLNLNFILLLLVVNPLMGTVESNFGG